MSTTWTIANHGRKPPLAFKRILPWVIFIMTENVTGNMSNFLPGDAEVIMDRFASATSVEDANDSLQAILNGFQSEDQPPWKLEWLWQHTTLIDHLLHVLQRGTLPHADIPWEDGVPLSCQLYQHLAKADSAQAMQRPAPGRLLEALLDIVDDKGRPSTTRVLALQVLQHLSSNQNPTLVAQWLQAPNGLHRLADLLQQEDVRDHTLAVATRLAHHAAIAKVFWFAEVEGHLLDVAWQQHGGLTGGNPFVLDALKFIQELATHADAALQDLVWSHPNVAPRLAQLLDLRGGYQFLNPTTDASPQGLRRQTSQSESPKQPPASAPIPRLLETEEQVVDRVLSILELLMDAESVRPTAWKQHAGLCSLLWELALINQTQPPVCALPSAFLQQRALELVATKFADPNTMDRHHGLDRLFYLVCTGGSGIATSLGQRLGISQASLAVLRQVLDATRIHEVLLHALAPPPDGDDENQSEAHSVVSKLWNTVAENLAIPKDAHVRDCADSENRMLFLSGALGALSVLCCDAESREMILKVTPPAASMEQMLQVVSTLTTSTTLTSTSTAAISWTLLRFLCEWVYESPRVVQELLGSTASTHLAAMVTADTQRPTTPLMLLLLGFTMSYYPTNESHECGGWTPDSIWNLMETIGVSKITSTLEDHKKEHALQQLQMQNKLGTAVGLVPWAACELESRYWSTWYQNAVWVVRKRVVEQVTLGSTSGDSADDNAGTTTEKPETSATCTTPNGDMKQLQQLITQQTQEIQDMRSQWENAETKIEAQGRQLEVWRRRMESTPTELDNMLTEFTSKSAKLEEKVQTMQEEALQTKEKHAKQIEDLEEQINDHRREYTKLEESERETRGEYDQIEQDLLSLSQAYASLEEEYRHNLDNQAQDGVPKDEGSPESTHGPNQHGVGSTEVSTLRAENERLREGAKTADGWMATATEQMQEMETKNKELDQQVKTLQSQLDELTQNPAAESKLASGQALRRQVTTLLQSEQALQHQVAELESKVKGCDRETSELRQQLKANEIKAQQQAERMVAIREEEWNVIKRRLEMERLELRRQLDEANQRNPLVVELQADAKDEKIMSLTASLEKTKSPSEEVGNTE